MACNSAVHPAGPHIQGFRYHVQVLMGALVRGTPCRARIRDRRGQGGIGKQHPLPASPRAVLAELMA